MGAMLSKFKPSQQTVCEPTDSAEYSDGEEIFVIKKYNKHDLEAARRQMNNYPTPDTMDGLFNHKPTAATNRPMPGLIPKNKFSRVPDLQKIVPFGMPRINGYPSENETSSSSTRNPLVNGNGLSYKPLNCQRLDNTLGRKISNYFSSTVSSTRIFFFLFFVVSLRATFLWSFFFFSFHYRVVRFLIAHQYIHYEQYRMMLRTNCDTRIC